MRRRRLSDRERGLGPALVWNSMGNGWTHTRLWVRGGDVRECDTPGCIARFVVTRDRCPECGNATVPLQWGD